MRTNSIKCPVRANAEARPNSAAVVTEERTWSWAALDERVSAAASTLSEIAPPGSRIAVRMPTSVEFVALILAALRTGHVLAPISTRLPQSTADRQAEHIAAAFTVQDPEPPPVERAARPIGEQRPSIPLDRPATIIHTSGSTGEAKAALLSVGNHVWSARGLAEVIPLAPSDRWLLNLPLSHVGGLAIVYRCALAGSAIVLPDAESTTGEAVEKFKATHASLVSTQLFRLLGEESTALDSLKVILLGGSATPLALLRAAAERRLPIYTSYGLTEMSSTVAVCRAGADGSVVRVLPHREIEIREGEIFVRGRTLFQGYVDGAAVDQPFDADGWFATGDLGCVDETTGLAVTGRKDNRFISGGENIQPEEIEAVIMSDGRVINAIVVPVADPEFGFRPVAFVQTESDLDSDRVLAALSATLPRFKLPVAIYPWPFSGEMKPDRLAFSKEAERRWTK